MNKDKNFYTKIIIALRLVTIGLMILVFFYINQVAKENFLQKELIRKQQDRIDLEIEKQEILKDEINEIIERYEAIIQRNK